MLWYNVYRTNRQLSAEMKWASKRQKTLAALSEVPGRRFHCVDSSYDVGKKAEIAAVAM